MTIIADLPHLPGVQALLQAEASALRAQWEAQDAQQLEAVIQQYKVALAQVLDECRRLGERALE